MALTLKVAQYLDINELVLMGDYADCYCVSSYKKSVKLNNLFKKELDDINLGLDQIDNLFPDIKKIYLEGNHEARFEKFLLDSAPELFGITEYKLLIKLKERPNWTWIPYNYKQFYKVLGTKLLARHSPPSNSSAKANLTRAMRSICYGHIHKIEQFNQLSANNEQEVAFSMGWLGDERFTDVFGYSSYRHNWQLGFGIVWADNSNFYHQIVRIEKDFSCVVDGKRFKA